VEIDSFDGGLRCHVGSELRRNNPARAGAGWTQSLRESALACHHFIIVWALQSACTRWLANSS
jgi:hypothetical protein